MLRMIISCSPQGCQNFRIILFSQHVCDNRCSQLINLASVVNHCVAGEFSILIATQYAQSSSVRTYLKMPSQGSGAAVAMQPRPFQHIGRVAGTDANPHPGTAACALSP